VLQRHFFPPQIQRGPERNGSLAPKMDMFFAYNYSNGNMVLICLNLQYDTVIWENQVYFTMENEGKSAKKLIFFSKNGIQPRIYPSLLLKSRFFRGFRRVLPDLKEPPLPASPNGVGVLGAAGPIEAAEDLVGDPGPGAEEREVKNHAWPEKNPDGNHSLIYH